MKIISVVPSLTELLFDLGLEEEVIGITKFCVHPNHWFKNKTRIGGTKNLNIEKIQSLEPYLIIANKEENIKEQIEQLQQQFQVFVSDIHTIEEALETIHHIAELVNKQEQGQQIILKIEHERSKFLTTHPKLKTLYLIWKNPYMAAGSDTFIHSMMQTAGFKNCVIIERYPTLSIDEIVKLNPEVVLLSSEPFPFKQKHVDELNEILPQAKILLVDGELFSWYGSRMSQSFEYFRALNEKIISSY